MKRISAWKPKRFPHPAFTLIELLIVVGIIAVMAALIIAVINPVQLRRAARDSNRKKDLGIMAQAMEQYYANENSYPDNTTYTDFDDLIDLLTGSGGGDVYVKSLQHGQNSDGDIEYCYEANATFQDYVICAPMESDSTENNSADAGDPAGDGAGCTPTDPPNFPASETTGVYCVYNPF